VPSEVRAQCDEIRRCGTRSKASECDARLKYRSASTMKIGVKEKVHQNVPTWPRYWLTRDFLARFRG
jgi:hypothetical protein